MLVSALMGREKILAAYEEAIKRQYRFYSLGDAMLLLPHLTSQTVIRKVHNVNVVYPIDGIRPSFRKVHNVNLLRIRLTESDRHSENA